MGRRARGRAGHCCSSAPAAARCSCPGRRGRLSASRLWSQAPPVSAARATRVAGRGQRRVWVRWLGPAPMSGGGRAGRSLRGPRLPGCPRVRSAAAARARQGGGGCAHSFLGGGLAFSSQTTSLTEGPGLTRCGRRRRSRPGSVGGSAAGLARGSSILRGQPGAATPALWSGPAARRKRPFRIGGRSARCAAAEPDGPRRRVRAFTWSRPGLPSRAQAQCILGRLALGSPPHASRRLESCAHRRSS